MEALTAREAVAACAHAAASPAALLGAALERYARHLKFSGALEPSTLRQVPPSPPAPTGRLTGVTLCVGADWDIAGAPTTGGCGAAGLLQRAVPPASAELLGRLLKEGAQLVCQTTMSPLGYGWTGQSVLGAVKNVRPASAIPAYTGRCLPIATYQSLAVPAAHARTHAEPPRLLPPRAYPALQPWSSFGVSGGAQAGAAAAVAGRLVHVALARDTLGEAVVPAALCGVVAFRPSHARYYGALLRGVLSLCPTLDTVTLLARTVDDVALVDDAVCAAGSLAPLSAGAPTEPAVAAVAATAVTSTTAAPTTAAPSALPMAGMRLGIPRSPATLLAAVDPALDAVVCAAQARMAKAGAELVDVELPADLAQ